MCNRVLYRLNPYIIVYKILQSYVIIDIQSNKYHIINKDLFAFVQYIEQTNKSIAYVDLISIAGESVTKYLISQGILIESLVVINNVTTQKSTLLSVEESDCFLCRKIRFMDTYVSVHSYNSTTLQSISDIYQSFVIDNSKIESQIKVFILKSHEKFRHLLERKKWIHRCTIFDIKIYDDLKREYKQIIGNGFSCFYNRELTNIYIIADNEQICTEVSRVLIDLSIEINLRQNDWVAIHSAAIQDKQHHILFMGTSGIGKSTLAMLTCKTKSGFELVSDEKYYINTKSQEQRGYCYGSTFSQVVKKSGIDYKTIDKSCKVNMDVSDLKNKENILVFMEKMHNAPVLTELNEKQIIKAVIKAVLDSNHNFGMIIRGKEYFINLLTAYDHCLANARCYQLNSAYDKDCCLKAICAAIDHDIIDSFNLSVNDDIEPLYKYEFSNNHLDNNEISLCINQFVLKIVGDSTIIKQISNEYNSYIVEGVPSTYIITAIEGGITNFAEKNVRWQSDRIDLKFSETRDYWYYYFDNKCLIQYDKLFTKAIVVFEENENGYSYVRSIIGYVIQMLSIKKGDICIHAALLRDKNGDGIIILGPKGSGKTTICYWLLGLGYTIQSDETTILRSDRGDFYALGIRRNLTLRDDISKHHICGGQQLYFPFSKEKNGARI